MNPALSRIYAPLAGLVAVLVLIKIFDVVVAPEHVYPGRTAVFPVTELVLVAAACALGGFVATRSATVRVWPIQTTPGNLLRALGLGMALGVGLAALDAWLRIGDMSVGLPLAPVFYLWGAISQEVLTHFAPVALVIGLLTLLPTGERAHSVGFTAVALAMSTLAAISMALAFRNPNVPLATNVAAAPIFIAAAVFVIELVLFAVFARQGLVATLATRLGFYAVWHIAWPALVY